MKDLIARLQEKLKGLSPATICAIGLLYVSAVAFADCVAPARVGFTSFYLLGAAFVGWAAGKRQVLLVVLVSSLIIIVHDWQTNRATPQLWVTLWNISARVLAITSVGLLTAEVARLTRNLGQLVEERTAQWKAEAQQHKTTAESLRLSQRQLAEAMDLAQLASWEYDVPTQLFTVNDRFWRLYGTSVEREKGYQVTPETYAREFLYPEDGPLVLEQVEKALATADPNYSVQLERRVRRRDGQTRHMLARVAITKDAAGRTVKIRGVNQDITELKRLERQLLEIADREQARIGQDLHDGLCQQLVSLAFDANALESKLSNQHPPEAAIARRLAGLLDQSITEARQLSRGLFPIRLEADGLPSALEELARFTSSRLRVDCRFQTTGQVTVKDRTTATHLYRIAQEAVTNAVKHARPNLIRIQLLAQPEALDLRVEDDGCGLSPDTPTKPTSMGLHIMDYRARTIGATLRLAPAAHGGTTVICRLPGPDGHSLARAEQPFA